MPRYIRVERSPFEVPFFIIKHRCKTKKRETETSQRVTVAYTQASESAKYRPATAQSQEALRRLRQKAHRDG